MSGYMPYVVEKGGYFSVFESRLANIDDRIAILGGARAGTPLVDLIGLDSPSLGRPTVPPDPGAGDHLTVEQRIEHFNEHWLGMKRQGVGWAKQPATPTTGFWKGYRGDPEAILRQAMIRGIEVSLGIEPDAVPDPCCLPRRWPIDCYWICQGSFFQCWVLWRQSDTSDDGHVSVLLTTPGAEGYPLTPQITRPVVDPNTGGWAIGVSQEYECPPPPAARLNRRGMWVIGHRDYTKSVGCQVRPTPKGEFEPPSLRWSPTNIDEVVCVAPAEWEGGVLHDGRPYTK